MKICNLYIKLNWNINHLRISYHIRTAMSNAKDHRFASLIARNDALKSLAPAVTFNFTKSSTPGVFHFGALGPTPTNGKRKRVRHTRQRTRKPKSSKSPPSTECSICMETISGNVTLKCGHEMCPACYAMQSRVNNTCPYCRVEFAPKVKKPPPLRIPIQEAESIVEDTIKDYYYDDVDDELVAMLKESGQLSETQINEIQLSVYCHLYQSSLNVVHVVDEWLEENDD